MRFLLDTNIISNLVRDPQGRITANIARVGEENVCTSIVVAAELRYGIVKRQAHRLAKDVQRVLDIIEVMPFESPADKIYGEVRSQLESTGKPVGANDMLIAAHALASGCVLVTDNEEEFSHVEKLRIENWLRKP